MTDEQFQTLISAAQDIQYLIIKSGGMANKSKVENVLMAQYGIDRSDAHSILNHVEGHGERAWRLRSTGIAWIAKRPEPKISDYLL